jgi:hypothetical protein
VGSSGTGFQELRTSISCIIVWISCTYTNSHVQYPTTRPPLFAVLQFTVRSHPVFFFSFSCLLVVLCLSSPFPIHHSPIPNSQFPLLCSLFLFPSSLPCFLLLFLFFSCFLWYAMRCDAIAVTLFCQTPPKKDVSCKTDIPLLIALDFSSRIVKLSH